MTRFIKVYNGHMAQHSTIEMHFTTTLYELKDWLIIRIPHEESSTLPSRGQVSVYLTVNGREISTVLEPDGHGSHWVRIDEDLQQELDVAAGSRVQVGVRTNPVWPEPTIPQDVAKELASASDAVKNKWRTITPMARWEWIRWINATSSASTRAVRIEKTISKLAGSHRRPCCFNLAACTEPYVAKNGRLIEEAK